MHTIRENRSVFGWFGQLRRVFIVRTLSFPDPEVKPYFQQYYQDISDGVVQTVYVYPISSPWEVQYDH